MSTPSYLDKLRELSARLSKLLEDPHPGLSTWCEAIDMVMADLATARILNHYPSIYPPLREKEN